MSAAGESSNAPLKEVLVKVPADATTCTLAHSQMGWFTVANGTTSSAP